MAEFVMDDAFLSLGGTDLSDHVASVTLNYEGDLKDKSAMSDTTVERIAGVKDWSLDVEFNQDFSTSSVDDTIWTALDGGSTLAVILRPTSDAVGGSNPEFTGNVLVESYPIVDGAHGDLASTSITFQGTGALARATS